jgi:iron complex transport system ATP-binding protein
VTEPVLRFTGSELSFGSRTLWRDLDLDVEPGEFIAVLGPNGSGKTTLLQVVSLYLWPTSGTVDVLGGRFGRIDAREHRRRIGYAGSALEAAMDESLSPAQLVLSARHAALAPWWHVYDDADRARVAALADRLGITHVADHPFHTLSSGERRRVSIARALMPDPDLLLLDEPGAGLDLGARETLIGDLTALAADDRPESIVLVSHHVEEIPRGFGHALVPRRGGPSRPGGSRRS